MQTFKKCISGLLVLSLLGFFFPAAAFCGGLSLLTKAEKKTITRHEPQIRSAPEQEIPMVAPEGRKKRSSMKYLWMGLGGAALVGLIAAIASGGSGGDDGDSDSDNDNDNDSTGTIAINAPSP